MTGRRRPASAPRPRAPQVASPLPVTAHELCNVVGALQLRFGVLQSDPTCRWAQEENLTAIGELLRQAMALARSMEMASSPSGPELVGIGARRAISPKRRTRA